MIVSDVGLKLEKIPKEAANCWLAFDTDKT
jgi:hypothetical protein